MVITPSYLPLWFLLIIIGAGIGFYLYKRKNKRFMFLTFYSIFFVYILFVLRYTQFPIYIQTPEEIKMPYSQIIESNIIFVPQLSELLSSTGLANMFMTIPFGFGLGFLIKVNFKKVLLYGFLFSLSLEVLQFLNMMITQVSQRTVNINDLINNTLGAVIGFFLFLLFIKCFTYLMDKSNLQLKGFTKYIYDL